jgi:glucuronoarabinoxylan endo-1,4-beta-xylanase
MQKAGFLPLTSVGPTGAAPSDLQLRQNYPNPFNPSTTISFSLPHGTETVLEVVDMLGRTVATLVDGRLDAGPHVVTFDPRSAARGLASGPYWYRLRTPNASATRLLYYLR